MLTPHTRVSRILKSHNADMTACLPLAWHNLSSHQLTSASLLLPIGPSRPKDHDAETEISLLAAAFFTKSTSTMAAKDLTEVWWCCIGGVELLVR